MFQTETVEVYNVNYSFDPFVELQKIKANYSKVIQYACNLDIISLQLLNMYYI